MAYTAITLKNPKTGAIKEAPIGFSWTVFFFGFFPPLFRGDWKWAVIILLIALITWGLSNLIFMFIYNKLYIKDLIGSGFKAQPSQTGDLEAISSKLGIEVPQLEAA